MRLTCLQYNRAHVACIVSADFIHVVLRKSYKTVIKTTKTQHLAISEGIADLGA